MDYICVFLWWKIVLEHTIQRLKMTTHLLFIAYSVRFLLTGIAAVGMPAPYPTALFTGLLTHMRVVFFCHDSDLPGVTLLVRYGKHRNTIDALQCRALL